MYDCKSDCSAEDQLYLVTIVCSSLVFLVPMLCVCVRERVFIIVSSSLWSAYVRTNGYYYIRCCGNGVSVCVFVFMMGDAVSILFSRAHVVGG